MFGNKFRKCLITFFAEVQTVIGLHYMLGLGGKRRCVCRVYEVNFLIFGIITYPLYGFFYPFGITAV